jgi:DNA repair photolyase
VSRYAATSREQVDDGWGALDAELPPLRTELIPDASRSIINYNNSPDIPFDRSINPYRGCEHGCIYCYARPSHAYLGLSPGLDFESKIFHKPDAAVLLEKELAKPGYRCAPIALGGNTDIYQPAERDLKITRHILEVLNRCNHPVTLVTKSALIERDMDLLGDMARRKLIHVAVTITTLNKDLARTLEPRATAPHRRLETVRRLSKANIPVTVMVAPIIQSLNDSEMENILQQAADVGAHDAHTILLRLPLELTALFEEWLQQHYPLKAGHVMSLIRQSRNGKTNDARFGSRMRGSGPFADMIAQRFRLARARLPFSPSPPLDTSQFTPPKIRATTQLDLFDAL